MAQRTNGSCRFQTDCPSAGHTPPPTASPRRPLPAIGRLGELTAGSGATLGLLHLPWLLPPVPTAGAPKAGPGCPPSSSLELGCIREQPTQPSMVRQVAKVDTGLLCLGVSDASGTDACQDPQLRAIREARSAIGSALQPRGPEWPLRARHSIAAVIGSGAGT